MVISGRKSANSYYCLDRDSCKKNRRRPFQRIINSAASTPYIVDYDESEFPDDELDDNLIVNEITDLEEAYDDGQTDVVKSIGRLRKRWRDRRTRFSDVKYEGLNAIESPELFGAKKLAYYPNLSRRSMSINSVRSSITESALIDAGVNSSSTANLGLGTVTKIDQLLMQISDLKQSVVDMDTDLFHYSQVVGSEPINVVEDDVFYFKEEPHTPSLEWDANDLALIDYELSESIRKSVYIKDKENYDIRGPSSNHLHYNGFRTPSVESLIAENEAIEVDSRDPREGASVPDSLALMQSSASTLASLASSSGNSSLLSSPEDEETAKMKMIQSLLAEAKSLDLLNELLNFLLVKTKRN